MAETTAVTVKGKTFDVLTSEGIVKQLQAANVDRALIGIIANRLVAGARARLALNEIKAAATRGLSYAIAEDVEGRAD